MLVKTTGVIVAIPVERESQQAKQDYDVSKARMKGKGDFHSLVSDMEGLAKFSWL